MGRFFARQQVAQLRDHEWIMVLTAKTVNYAHARTLMTGLHSPSSLRMAQRHGCGQADAFESAFDPTVAGRDRVRIGHAKAETSSPEATRRESPSLRVCLLIANSHQFKKKPGSIEPGLRYWPCEADTITFQEG